jgi:hypothetical protein
VDSQQNRGGWREWLAHAFAVEKYDASSLSDEEQAVLTQLARQIHSRGLTTPAILWLSSNRHMSWLGSQALVATELLYDMAHPFIHPFLKAVGLNVKPAEMPLLYEALEKRYSVEFLMQQLEAAQAGELEETEELGTTNCDPPV